MKDKGHQLQGVWERSEQEESKREKFKKYISLCSEKAKDKIYEIQTAQT